MPSQPIRQLNRPKQLDYSQVLTICQYWYSLYRTPAEAAAVSMAMAAAVEAQGLHCDRRFSPVGARGAHQLTT